MDLTKNVNEIITDMATAIDNTASYTNRLQRNKAYSAGDIAYSPNLPSWAYLECTTAGTTGETEPDFSGVVTKKTITILNIFTVTDGTVTWRLRDTRCKYEIGDIIPKVGNPKDYEYLILADGGGFDSSYTDLAKIFTDGKLPNLKDGRFLEGASEAGQVKGAGLPNITGKLNVDDNITIGHKETNSILDAENGAFSIYYSTHAQNTINAGADTWYHERGFAFDASKSNSIYGSSDTVQPKSYTVKYYICYGG